MGSPARPEDFAACPECWLPADITERVTFGSTDGPVEHVRVECVARHWFFLPADRLPVAKAPGQAA